MRLKASPALKGLTDLFIIPIRILYNHYIYGCFMEQMEGNNLVLSMVKRITYELNIDNIHVRSHEHD